MPLIDWTKMRRTGRWVGRSERVMVKRVAWTRGTGELREKRKKEEEKKKKEK